ncbi:bifunctional hydroxymethylpyrimidine kinase/phosphomethylpyrimidine kinase [Lactobacillus terrae]|uniref:bifunctional hydroxymethylpyrimidine kinase/phosphomethylpyrimidine kinase n=1 Tax=Lactobacillus terrae TaxID=2269374 RepID=UPI001474E96D|nr:bifunctional hydroxymethylpyrimidine kinase/phosphomethylpyrimidine kinase [Lactobacillus terrae]
MMNEFTQVLTIGGSDSDGSAGIQADLKTFQANNVYGMSVLTAAVAGNSYGIHDQMLMPKSFIESQIKDIKDDFKVSAFKTGMLSDSNTIKTVANQIEDQQFGFFVLDPVIITKHGDMLLEQEAYKTLIEDLFPLADLITPNYYEAQKLSGLELNSQDEIINAAKILQELGPKNVLIKGKHSKNETTDVEDYVLLEDGTSFWFSQPFVDTEHINGTGDTLSSTIVAQVALGKNLKESIEYAKKFTYQAIKNVIDVGHKYGPINHFIKNDII